MILKQAKKHGYSFTCYVISFQLERIKFEFIGDGHFRGFHSTYTFLEGFERPPPALCYQINWSGVWIRYHGIQLCSGPLRRRYRIIYAGHLRHFGTSFRSFHNGPVDSLRQLEGK